MAPPYPISDKSDKPDLTAVAPVARAGLFHPPSIRAGACAKITYRDPRELKAAGAQSTHSFGKADQADRCQH
jgi:hypothetical protein